MTFFEIYGLVAPVAVTALLLLFGRFLDYQDRRWAEKIRAERRRMGERSVTHHFSPTNREA